MTYYPTESDLKLLKTHVKEIYCRIDLMDKDQNVIDSLEGLTMDGSISIDAEADERRTFNSSIHLSEGKDVSEYSTDEWIDKLVHVYIGLKSPRSEIKWFSQGIYAFSENGFSYDSESHTLSISCLDLISKLDGTLEGQIAGFAESIQLDVDQSIKEGIRATFELSGMKKCLINYPDKTIPYTLEYDIGTTIWDILKELRDLYFPYEMFFDEDVFVCKEIPSGYDDIPMIENVDFSDLVISESASVDYSEVKNCIEVFGSTIEADTYSDDVTWDASSSTITIKTTGVSFNSRPKIAFLAPDIEKSKSITIKVINTVNGASTTYSSILYNSITDESGNDMAQDTSVISSGKYYVIKYHSNTAHFYYLGQQMAHAMVKLVSVQPTEEEISKQQQEENCKNLKFVVIEDSPYAIDKIGRRNEVLVGGEYDNYKTDEQALQIAEYELWKRSRLTDCIEVQTLLIPWIDVNQKIEYAPRQISDHIVREYLIKKINTTLGEGTMSMTLSRYYPYYPFIVNN